MNSPTRRSVLRSAGGLGLVPLLASRAASSPDTTAPATHEDADPPPVAWEWTEGVIGQAFTLYDVAELDDGSFVGAGFRSDEGGRQDGIIRNFDPSGRTRWEWTDDGTANDALLGVATDPGSDTIGFCGASQSRGSSAIDSIVGTTTADGRVDEPVVVGVPNTHDAVHAVAVAPNGDLVAAGGTQYLGGADGQGVGRVVRVDPATDSVVWEQTYDTAFPGEFYDIQATSRDTFAVVGQRQSTDGSGALWVGEIDGNGSVIWLETVGGPGDRLGWSLIESADGTLVYCGTTQPPGQDALTAWVGEIEPGGMLRWEETYGGLEDDVALSIVESHRRGYVVAGWTANAVTDESGWVFEIDESGHLRWSETYGTTGPDRFNAVTRGLVDGYATAGVTTDEIDVASAWSVGLGQGDRVLGAAAAIDRRSFVRVFPDSVRDRWSAQALARDRVDDLLAARAAGTLSTETVNTALDRLALGYEATHDLLSLAAPGGSLNFSRSIAEYLVSILLDLVMEKLALGEKLGEVAPDRLTRAVDSIGDSLGVSSEGSPLSITFFDDLIDYVLDLVMFDEGGSARSGVLARISAEAEAIFGDLWERSVDELESAGSTILDLKRQAMDALVDVVATFVQAGYETGALDLASTIASPTAFQSPGDLPSPIDDPVSVVDVVPDINGTWPGVYRINEDVPARAFDQGFSGTTDAGRRARRETVEDLERAVTDCDAWLSLVVDDMLSFDIVDNLASAFGAVKDLWQAEGIIDRLFATLSGIIDIVKALLGIVTSKVGLIASGSAALVGGHILATAANANEAVVESIIDGTDHVAFDTRYSHVPAPDETIPAYDEFRSVIA